MGSNEPLTHKAPYHPQKSFSSIVFAVQNELPHVLGKKGDFWYSFGFVYE